MYNADAAMAQFGILLVFFVLIALAVGLAIFIFYILTLRKALSRCAPQNRATSPDSAWLLLIPLFNLIWAFILYPKISESLEREFRSRNISAEPQPAKTLGLVLAIANVCCLVPIVNFVAGLAVLVCFIMYWVQIAGFSKQLSAAPAVYAQPSFAQQQTMAAAQTILTPQPAVAVSQPPTQSAFCTKCGHPLQMGERFCTSCGAPSV